MLPSPVRPGLISSISYSTCLERAGWGDLAISATHEGGWLVLAVTTDGPWHPEELREECASPSCCLDEARNQDEAAAQAWGLTMRGTSPARRGGEIRLHGQPLGGTARYGAVPPDQ
jgi:hypothetical protein